MGRQPGASRHLGHPGRDPVRRVRGPTPVHGDGRSLHLDEDTGRGVVAQPVRRRADHVQPRRHPVVGADEPVRVHRLHAVEADEVELPRGGWIRGGYGGGLTPRPGEPIDQEGRGSTGDHTHDGEPTGQAGEQAGHAVERSGGGGILHDRGECAVEVAEQRRVGRIGHQWREQGLGPTRQPDGSRGAAQVPVWVVVVADADLARSGATTTSTSAVPIVLTGAAVV